MCNVYRSKEMADLGSPNFGRPYYKLPSTPFVRRPLQYVRRVPYLAQYAAWGLPLGAAAIWVTSSISS
jgi:hypothetical protein